MKKILLFICLVILVVGGAWMFLGNRTSKVEVKDVVVKEVKAQEIPVVEKIWALLDTYNLTLSEKIDTMVILKCESHYDSYAINVNKDGSLDLGVAQFNGKHHPEVSRSCAFNIECAIKEMMRIYKKDGNFNQWACNK